MSRTADFQTSTWTDPWFQLLPPLQKLLFVYLWTNSHRELSGMYSISPTTIATETGLPIEDVPDLLNRLYPKVFYDHDKCFVFVVNMVKHQFMRGETLSTAVRTGIRKAIRTNAPRAHPFINRFCEAYPTIMGIEDYPFGEVNGEAPPAAAEPERRVERQKSGKPKEHTENERYLQFWAAYPRKDTGPKAPYKHWPHPMTDELFTLIMTKLTEFAGSEQWQTPSKIPMATTWLFQRRWEATVVKGASNGGPLLNALPAEPGKYAHVGARVQTDG